jgi:Uma2 family endonuclease
MATAELLLTIEDYVRLPDDGRPSELVRGRIVEMNPPLPRHGQIAANSIYLLASYIRPHELGHLVGNDSGVVTERDPDTLRGADLAFYSYAKVPRGPLPRSYLQVPPDLIFEVRSKDDRWRKVLTKVAEYLNAGVSVVCVLDEPPPVIHIYRPDERDQVLGADDELTIPEVLGDFRMPVRRFFE